MNGRIKAIVFPDLEAERIEEQVSMLEEMLEKTRAGKLRYVFIAVINTDRNTGSGWSGNASYIERVGLLASCMQIEDRRQAEEEEDEA